MGDVGEVFNQMREDAKMHRAEAQAVNAERLPALQAQAAQHGLRIEVKSDYHWNLYRGTECMAQFWPTKNKFQNTKTGKVVHGTGADMLAHVVRRL